MITLEVRLLPPKRDIPNQSANDHPELALLNRQARAASVRATSDKLVVAALGEQAFSRLLGPVKDIMARSVGEMYGFSGSR